MASTVFRVGVIGLGAMGREMVGEMQRHRRFQVVSAWDPAPEACIALAADHPGIEIGDAAAAVIDTDHCDVAYVASPPASHARYAHAAMDRGRALFCEKPLGIDLDDSHALADRVQRTGTANAVNFNHAAAYDADTVLGLLRSGELGEVRYVSMRLHLPVWPRPFQAEAAWLAGRNQGGFTREMLSHWIYLSQRLLGRGRLRLAHPEYPDDPERCEQGMLAELDFGGVPAHISARVGGAGPTGMEYTLWGERESCRLTSGGGLSRWDGTSWVADAPVPDTPGDRQRALDNLAALLDGQDNTCASIADALAVQILIEGMLAA